MKRFTLFFVCAVAGATACTTGPVGGGGPADEPDAAPTGPCIYYRDVDHDGYGDPSVRLDTCKPGPGYVQNAEDCDDSDPQVNPDTAWHPDKDGDGFGDPAMTRVQCLQPAGYIRDGGDCDDNDPKQHPGQIWYLDGDHDGFGRADMSMVSCSKPTGYVLDSRDCDDANNTIKPGLASCPFTAPNAKSCKDILDRGYATGDGAYSIDPDGAGSGHAYTVYCDMTSDGGGWTALINPTTMPNAVAPGVTTTWAHVGGTSSSCNGNPMFGSAAGLYSWGGSDCGSYTNAYSFDWANAFGAKDVKFAAILEGGTTHTLTVNGTGINAEAQSVDHICQFFNSAGAGLPQGVQTNSCAVYTSSPPSVHANAFTGALDITVTVGAGCLPNCTYGESFTLDQVYVR